jgi:hopanoid biosynthesis associated RND transporter like protein HpnN
VNREFDAIVSGWIAARVDLVRRHARLVVALNLLLTVALGIFTALQLGVNTDNKRLLAPDLPFQKAAAQFARYFPPLDDSLLLVIDGDTPELAREAARALTRRLRDNPQTFTDVYAPGAGAFFQRNGLLYRSLDELDDFTDHLARMQPVIADLSRDASIANLARLIRLGLEQEQARGSNDTEWSAVLDRFGEATVRVFDEYPVLTSWESLMLEGSAFDPGTRQVVVAEPVLDFGKLLAAKRAIGAIRAAARELSLVPERGVRVRITGNPALNYEEMLSIARDIGVAGILSFALVTAILFLAFRSLRLVSAAALTLLAGLVWTAAFAAVSVGSLNVLSISFGVLFIGLGVDFAIHLGMQYADAVYHGASSADALRGAASRVGSSLVLCTVTTAIGFFAFVPTGYRGVAELGLISGTGMLVILFQTVTLFPALIIVLLGDDARARMRAASHSHLAPPDFVARHPGAVIAVALALGLGALAQLPRMQFDSHVIKMRDSRTESVQAFNDLLEGSGTSPWSVDVLAQDLAHAERLGERFQQLDAVETTVTLSDYVPAHQEEKIEMLADAALLIDAPRGRAARKHELTAEEQIKALRDLHGVLRANPLQGGGAHAPLAGSVRQLRDQLGRFLARVASEENAAAALADLERILLGSFPRQLERLRRALEPPRIRLEDLPAEISRRMLASDGHARVQVFPRDTLADSAQLTRFVDAVRSVQPEATGVAVNLVEFGRATTRSLRQALFTAFLAIAVLLWLLWRRLTEMTLVLAPVLLAAVLTGASMVLLDIPFNFTNVVVLPLLLGIGVDSGIHLVHRSRSVGAGSLLETPTARAVFFSALTTIASFGSLALSGHRGVASLGTLLVCGMVITLACNLLVLPALIALRARWRTDQA